MDYFDNILGKVLAQGDRHGLAADDYAGLLAWAREHEPELRAEEARQWGGMEGAGDEQAFKKAALAYGKTLIKLFEKYAAWKVKKAAAAPVIQPEPPKRYEPKQARLGL